MLQEEEPPQQVGASAATATTRRRQSGGGEVSSSGSAIMIGGTGDGRTGGGSFTSTSTNMLSSSNNIIQTHPRNNSVAFSELSVSARSGSNQQLMAMDDDVSNIPLPTQLELDDDGVGGGDTSTTPQQQYQKQEQHGDDAQAQGVSKNEKDDDTTKDSKGNNNDDKTTPTSNQSDSNNARISKRGLLLRCLTELQCVVDVENSEKEQDPFAKRRLCFIFFIAIIAIVANLVVIPIALTKMEENKNYTTSPTTSPGGGESPLTTLSPTSSPATTTPPPAGQPTTLSPVTTPTLPTLPPQSLPTLPPQPPTTFMPTSLNIDVVLAVLPSYTLDTIQNFPNSAQAKALGWLAGDPIVGLYSSSRILQRFSLATIFYSTNDKYYRFVFDFQQQQGRSAGMMDHDIASRLFVDSNNNDEDNNLAKSNSNNIIVGRNRQQQNQQHQNQQSTIVYWNNSTNWLSYTIHECFWFSQSPYVCDAQQNYRFLTLNNNGLMGRLPPQLGLLSKLEQLDMSDNLKIYGSIPTHISQLTQLRSLQLSNLPQLSGTIPWDSMASSPLRDHLQQLQLRETPYVPKILSTQLGRLTKLRAILLDTKLINTNGNRDTSHESTIPTQLANLHQTLQEFAITGTEIIGTLPPQLSLLSNLKGLSITSTLLQGTIPSFYGLRMMSLSKLDLSHNSLSGKLPKDLSHLRSTLTSLALEDNRFTGTIPFQYSNLTKCKTMSYQQNRLTGTVPLGLCYLKTNNIIDVLKVDCYDEDTISASAYPLQCSCDCDCY